MSKMFNNEKLNDMYHLHSINFKLFMKCKTIGMENQLDRMLQLTEPVTEWHPKPAAVQLQASQASVPPKAELHCPFTSLYLSRSSTIRICTVQTSTLDAEVSTCTTQFS